MTRKKVKLAYISNDNARKATFKKRKKGLLKKVSELSTLCGIQTCAIIYSPYDIQPEVWPSPSGVQRAIARLKTMPDAEQSKKMVNQESFLTQRVIKATEQLKKQQRENREKEMTQMMYRSLIGEGLENFSIVDLNDLEWLIQKNIGDIDEKIASLQEKPPPQVTSHVSSTEGNDKEAKNLMDSTMDATQKRQWSMELLKSNEKMGLGRNEYMTAPSHQWLTELLKPNENVCLGRNEEPLPYAFNGDGLWSSFPLP